MLNFNNDILKSVYELRRSHAAVASRPNSSQPHANKRNIHSAVPRRPQQMQFGGFFVPQSVQQLHDANLTPTAGNTVHRVDDQMNIQTSGVFNQEDRILEIDEFPGRNTNLSENAEKAGKALKRSTSMAATGKTQWSKATPIASVHIQRKPN